VAFSIAQYAALRPTLWHLTHRQNLAFIKKSRLLMPADRLPAFRQVALALGAATG
jgi:hypothetical protein